MYKILLLVGLLILTASCSGQWTEYPDRDSDFIATSPYVEIGDMLNVNVFGETDLSGDYPVLGDGTIQIPLIGAIAVQGLTIDSATDAIISKFRREGYLINPQITLSVAQSRTVKIMGEIRQTGEFPYTSGMTILDLVVRAGGFSYRANQNKFDIVRKSSDGSGERVIDGDLSTQIVPGDIIRVKERYF